MKPASPVAHGLEPYETTIGAPEGSNCIPLPALRSPEGRVMSRWQPTDRERDMIASGADIYLTVWTNNSGYPPTSVQVLDVTNAGEYLRADLRLDGELELRMLREEMGRARETAANAEAQLIKRYKEIMGLS